MHSTIADLYPRMRTGIFFTPTAEGDGVLLANGSEIVTFHGASTYAWLEKLSPHLDGRHSVADLTASLPPAPRRMVEKLVGALYEAGLVRDVSRDEPHSLTPDELERYASEIAFIEAFRSSPGLRFQRYRQTPAVLIGSGAVFTAAVEAARLTGTARLSVRPTPAPGADADGGAAAAAEDVDTVPLDPSDAPALREAVEDAGLVLYAADRTDPVLLRSLDRLCAELGRTFVPVTVDGDEAWIGPVCAADRPAARWESLWLRLGTGAGAASGGTGFLTGPVPGILANHLVFRAFEHLTGVAGDAGLPPGGNAVRLDLETLQTSVHTLAPHPSAGGAAETGAGRSTAQAAPVGAEELAERVVPLTDDRLGVLGTVSEGHYEQFPLRVVRVTADDPRRPGAPMPVWGAGPDFPHARDAALRLGLAAHAVRGSGSGSGSGSEAVAGVSLADGREVRVPVDEVFVRSGDPADALPVGTAGATTWTEAVEQGLLAHVLRLTPAEPPLGAAPPRPCEELELAPAARRFLDLLLASGEGVTARAVPAPAGVHVLAFRLGAGDAGPVERGAGFTEAEAVEAGLGRLLLAWQSRTSGQAECAPSPTVSLRTSFGAGPAADEDPVRHRTLVAALHALGHEAVAVPLDRDPAVHAVLPHLVRVVLRDV
ncbi:hypothetical protein AB0F18_13545 [Streptomyces sp. NPDC029216]|uniref:hypothetical protein n=1 Tax=Streptomyces sp. NPDC029216 TaxID=3154701 RepID=UPI0033FEA0C5